MHESRYVDWDYKNSIAVEYERNGKCSQCGDCCKSHVQFREPVIGAYFWQPSDWPKKAQNKGKTKCPPVENGYPHRMWSSIEVDGKWRLIHFVSVVPNAIVCPSLFFENEKAFCNKHDDKHPVCSTWPLSPYNLEQHPNCSYTFREVRRWAFESAKEG